MKTILHPRYTESPLLSKYGSRNVRYRLKREVKAFDKWFNKTYPLTYKDIKEGDCFILWNGDGVPVPFVQMKDERVDKHNRPTRLLDGCYYGLSDERVRLSTRDECVLLKKEITNYSK